MNDHGNFQANVIVDLNDAVIVVPGYLSKREENAVRMLREEVQARSNILWLISDCWPQTEKPTIYIGRFSDIDQVLNECSLELNLSAGFDKTEGYQVRVHRDGGRFRIFVLGNDERGILFGVALALIGFWLPLSIAAWRFLR